MVKPEAERALRRRYLVSGNPLSGSISQTCVRRKFWLSTLIKGFSTEEVQYSRAHLSSFNGCPDFRVFRYADGTVIS